MKSKTTRFLSVAMLAILVVPGALFAQEKPTHAKHSSLSSASNSKADHIIASLERTVSQLMKEGDIPGLSIALIRGGDVAWYHGFGIKNAKTSEPVSDNTVFEAASLSKPVFAYAVLKLVDGGKFDLDKPLNQYLPGDYDVGPDPRLSRITARRVLSHTTGFPNWRQGGALKIYFSPGERFSYSGEGFVYLSKVIEHISGEKFDDFMKRMVFDPLGMSDSSYVWQSKYDSMKSWRHNALGEVSGQNKTVFANAAASLHTTARDYGRFVAAIINGTGLKKETAALMLTPQVQVPEGGMNTVDRTSIKVVSNVSWGLGIGLQTTEAGLAFWHWGDNGDAKAYVLGYPGRKTGMVVLTNSANGLSIMKEICDLAIGGEQPALAWINYESYRSPARVFLKDVLANGADAALRQYRQYRVGKPASQLIDEAQMNRLGYTLLYAAKRVKDAIEVLKQNVEDFPQSWNTYDSLGEAYMVDGNKELAIKNYQRAVEMNPKDADGIDALKKLREK